jgi:hypothetical protein
MKQSDYKEKEMNLDTKPGQKVVFNHPNDGMAYDIDLAKKHLVLGKVYTIEHILVYPFYTEIFLEGLPCLPFNSVQFDNYNVSEIEG